MPKYCFEDYDAELKEVYAFDFQDFKLYGMPYEMNGDKVNVLFNKCKRKKVCYVDFEEGDANFSERNRYGNVIPKLREKFMALQAELKELRVFKEKIDEQARKDAAKQIFANFQDLAGNPDFAALQENFKDMTAAQIEEKCFAIRGRSMSANFALNQQVKPIRLPIDAQERKDADEPYGGIFTKYGIGTK